MKRKTKMALADGIGLTAVIAFLLTPVLLLALAGCDTAESSEPADAEIEAVARRLLWRSCEWDGIDGDYAAKDEEDAWDYAGEILGWREGFIERARDLLETSRKAVTES